MPSLIHLSADPAAVAADFARYFAEELAENTGRFYVALSGGSTPKLLFEHWTRYYTNSLDWSRVHFFWGDERCVPPDDAASNYGMTKRLFLEPAGIPATQVHRIRGEEDPFAEADRYAQEIREWVPSVDGLPAFDLIILGLGDDGHTASIFAHQMELLQTPTICAVATHPQSGQQRITLSGTVINQAQRVAFLVTGAHKREKVSAILKNRAACLSYPAAHIQPVQGELHWFLDDAAYG
ncbi:MAG: 6-phosphogluconolactonase [Bacteroidetes bacterium]|nr:MAG: 6-phosphogluconolactonase [Bacteroidota bacterium]